MIHLQFYSRSDPIFKNNLQFGFLYYLVLSFIFISQILALRRLEAQEISEQNFLFPRKDNLFQRRRSSQIESRLLHEIFKTRGYNPKILPLPYLNSTIIVSFKVDLVQIIGVEEKAQVLKTNVWIQMTWNDFQLKWDPQIYGGIKNVRVTPSEIWKPDIVLLNNADGNYDWAWQPKAILEHNGDILWLPPALFISSCIIDVEFFPFDQQDCKIKFGSMTFPASLLKFDRNATFLFLDQYFKSGSWDVIAVPGYMKIESSGGQKGKAQIIYSLKLRRKTLFYTVNLILPCIMISLLSICVFYLPADAGEKMTLCISILFALVVFLLLISRILPPTSTSIPLISRYLLFTFVINIFAILITVLIINWNYRTTRTHAMPKWVRKVFMEILPKLLGMRRPMNVEMEIKLRSYLQNPNKKSASNSKTIDESYNQQYNPQKSFTVSPIFSNHSRYHLNTIDDRFNQRTFSSDSPSKKSMIYSARSFCNICTQDEDESYQVSYSSSGSVYSLNQTRKFANFTGHSSLNLVNLNDNSSSSQSIKAQESPISLKFGLKHSFKQSGVSSLRFRNTFSDPDEQSLSKDTTLRKCSTIELEQLQPNHAIKFESADIDPAVYLTKNLSQDQQNMLKSCIKRAACAINYISAKLHDDSEYELVYGDWKYVASVIDRLMLVIFVLVTTVGTFSIFIRAPYLFDKFDQDAFLDCMRSKAEEGKDTEISFKNPIC